MKQIWNVRDRAHTTIIEQTDAFELIRVYSDEDLIFLARKTLHCPFAFIQFDVAGSFNWNRKKIEQRP